MKKILKRRNARKEIRTLGIKSYKSAIKRKKVKDIIDIALMSGKMVGVHWTKKDGEPTKGCFTKKKMNLAGGINTLSNYPQYITRPDINRINTKTGERGRFTAILLDTVHTIKADGRVHTF